MRRALAVFALAAVACLGAATALAGGHDHGKGHCYRGHTDNGSWDKKDCGKGHDGDHGWTTTTTPGWTTTTVPTTTDEEPPPTTTTPPVQPTPPVKPEEPSQGFCVQTVQRGETFVQANPGSFSPGGDWFALWQSQATVVIAGQTVTLQYEGGKGVIEAPNVPGVGYTCDQPYVSTDGVVR